MRRYFNILFLAIVTVLLIQACNISTKKSRGISEGVMKYEITYLEDENTNPIISLMPSYMSMSFKDNSVVMVVEGWMGIFKSTFIKNYKDSESITLLKILNKKYCYKSGDANGFIGFSDFKKVKIEYDDKVKKILDFNCNHAVVTVPDRDLTFDIYYTKDINIDRPNEFTPFAEVPGVLMDFRIKVNGIAMHLSASEIIEVDVPNDAFAIPEDYDVVSKEQLNKIFSEII